MESQRLRKKQKGFTIVELLIVVVVIAILAAITIVAYNGIQNRAKTSAVQTTVKQAYSKIQTYAVQSAELYPTSLSAAGLNATDGIEYQYYVNNAASPRQFCVMASNSTAAFYLTESRSTPQKGTCHEQNLVSTDISKWVTGDYSQTTGAPNSTASRIRHTNLVAVTPGATYTQDTGNPTYSFVLRGFGQDQSFASNIGGIVAGDPIVIPSNVYYIGVGIYGSSGASYETYQQGFANGSFSPRIILSQ